MTDDTYHQTRFSPDPRRKVLWQTLVAHVFQKQIPPDAVVLELGAGYGDFINAVKAKRRAELTWTRFILFSIQI